MFTFFVFSEKPYFFRPLPLATMGEFGRELTLECPAIGTPTPKVTWFRNGVPVSEQRNLRIREMNNSLHINFLRLEDSGMLECEAENEAGNIVGYTWLRVKSKFSFQKIRPYFLSLPNHA